LFGGEYLVDKKETYFLVKETCGKPEIKNIMQNLTLTRGESARYTHRV
jgi:hypothetical protein